MYKVRMKTKWARPDGSNRIGDILTLPDELAKRLIDSKSADLIEIISDAIKETAMIHPVENAMQKKPQTRKR